MRKQRERTTQPLTTDAKDGLHHCAMCSATWLVAGARRVSARERTAASVGAQAHRGSRTCRSRKRAGATRARLGVHEGALRAVLVDEVVLPADRAVPDERAEEGLRLRNKPRLVSTAHTRCAIASARAWPPRSALAPRGASRADTPKARAQRCTFACPCALARTRGRRERRAPPCSSRARARLGLAPCHVLLDALVCRRADGAAADVARFGHGLHRHLLVAVLRVAHVPQRRQRAADELLDGLHGCERGPRKSPLRAR
jgi:hypothetical protein